MREIKNVAIIGAGTMGTSMAQALAKYGYKVSLYDLFPETLKKSRWLMEINLVTEVEEKILTQDEARTVLNNIEYVEDISQLKNSDFVIEAIIENLQEKHKFWKELCEIVEDDTILASNTSGLSITKIAEVIKCPERFAGMHWINPPHIVPLIEIIKGEKTTDEVADTIFGICEAIEKKPVIVNDAPGFVLNRLQFAVMRECLHIVEEGIATKESVDDVMKYALGFRYACLGPFEIADIGGLDVFDNIASYLFEDLSDRKDSFAELKENYKKGNYGIKSGRGFYDYSEGKDEEKIMYRDQMFTKLSKCLFAEEK